MTVNAQFCLWDIYGVTPGSVNDCFWPLSEVGECMGEGLLFAQS